MKNNKYLKLNWLSIFFIFMLFAIGGLVRSTGSGMGCPDWPKCFGEYIPPISESQLPLDYQDFYKDQRLVKTKRFVSLLRAIGLETKADEIQNSVQLEGSHQFNLTKAYVEYANRLWGATTGIVVFICFLLSFVYIRTNKAVFIYSLFGFLAVFINALLGAVVVNSNLVGGIVTIHFIAAFASIFFFILARRAALDQKTIPVSKNIRISALILITLNAIQVVMGAQVREIYDLLIPLSSLTQKTTALYPHFQLHAILGVSILIISLYQFIQQGKNNSIGKYMYWVALLAIGQVVIGPLALVQSLVSISKLFHISLGAGIFVLQFYICTLIFAKTKDLSSI